MAVGLNGQPVLSGWDDPALTTISVVGSKVRLTVHKGWFQRVAAYVAWRWNREVEPLKAGECWGFDYRPARAAGGAWSSHSTGYCIDLNSNGAGSQLWGDRRLKATAAQMRAMSRIKKDTGLLWGGPRWAGGDYGPSKYAQGAWVDAPGANYVDPMHWDLPKGVDAEAWCKALCERLRIGPDGRPQPALSAHQLHVQHLANTGSTAPVASTPTHLSPHQQHLLHLAQKPPSVQPVPTGSGPYWWLRFLRAHTAEVGVYERAWWAIAGRESNFQPGCLYPSGAPWGDWQHGNGKHFDTGVLQVNDRHLDQVRAMFGASADMSKMLDPTAAWKFALKYLQWSDWGLVIAPDGKSYRFDWTGWPSPYRPGESGAVAAEKAFAYWWNQYPVAVKKVYG